MLDYGWNPNLYGHNDVGLYIVGFVRLLTVSKPQIHPMTVAAASFPPSVVKILLDHGVCTRGTMAMHAAASNAANDPSRFEVLDLLLSFDGDVNEMEVDPKGRNPPRRRTSFTGTPLHHAIECDSIESVQYLLQKGASPWAPGWSGENALKVAERYNRTKIAETIRNLSPPEYSSLSKH